MPPPSCTSTFQWMETNIMLMVKLKVSASLLGLLSALALKHTGDAQIGIGTPEFWCNHELGFYFSIWKDKCKRKVYNTVRLLSSDLLPKVLCLCNLLAYYVWHWLSPRLSQTMRCAIGGPRASSDLTSLCAGWKSIVLHNDAPVCVCIIMSAHPPQSWVPCASSGAGRFWRWSPLKRFFKPRSTYHIQISV